METEDVILLRETFFPPPLNGAVRMTPTPTTTTALPLPSHAVPSCHFSAGQVLVELPIVMHNAITVQLYYDPLAVCDLTGANLSAASAPDFAFFTGQYSPGPATGDQCAPTTNLRGGERGAAGNGDHAGNASGSPQTPPASSGAVTASALLVPPMSWFESSGEPVFGAVPGESYAAFLRRFLEWIVARVKEYHRNLFATAVAATNMRVQFEYASYLQGLSLPATSPGGGTASAVDYFVARAGAPKQPACADTASEGFQLSPGGGSYVVSLVVPFFFIGAVEQSQLRQLLFRVATSTLEYESESERTLLLAALECCNEGQSLPVNAAFECILVAHDEDIRSVRVVKEDARFHGVPLELLVLPTTPIGYRPPTPREDVPPEYDDDGNMTLGMTVPEAKKCLHRVVLRLVAELEALFPLHCTSTVPPLPKLVAAGTTQVIGTSFIDLIPSLESVIGEYSKEFSHWCDCLQCLSEELGPPIICQSYAAPQYRSTAATKGLFRDPPLITGASSVSAGGAAQSGVASAPPAYDATAAAGAAGAAAVPRFAVFAATDDLTQNTFTVFIRYNGRRIIPTVSMASAHFSVRNSQDAIRVQVQYDESAVLLTEKPTTPTSSSTICPKVVDAVRFADATRAFIDKNFPKFYKACEMHAKIQSATE